MTVSIQRMSLGTGFEYLMSSIARGDGAAPTGSPLTRYYVESGTPPGRFLGTGLAGLADGLGVRAGSEVSEEALWRLLGMMVDPVTGIPLGRSPQRWPASLQQRMTARVKALPPTLSDQKRNDVAASTPEDERRREATLRRPVAGFDLTFSVPKSVSVLWALADADVQEVIHQAHRDAIDLALGWAERNIAFTRTGAGGRIQEPVRGLIAAAFDHWDSRAGDPHLHTHVVVANRVQTADGTWRSLDGATLFRYTVGLSELHEGVLQDLLTERLGLAWTTHPRRHSLVPRWDVDGIPVELIDEFSTRARAIDSAKDDLAAAFAAQHGRQPTNVEVLKLRQQATLATRPGKTHRTLAAQMGGWKDRAGRLDSNLVATDAALNRTDLPRLTAETIDDAMAHALGASALAAVSATRAVFTEANVLAEVHRQLHGAHFATAGERLTTAERITRHVLDLALALDTRAHPAVPRHRGTVRYTTATILDAETRLLDATRDLTGPSMPRLQAGATSLTADQATAVDAVATSGRVLDLLVGPAGSGKTTSLAALKDGWQAAHGGRAVIGLAPSATAAQVLGDELAISTENTAKWLTEQSRNDDRRARLRKLQAGIDACSSLGTALARQLTREIDAAERELARWTVQQDQLVIIDEASLAGTLALDAIVTSARDAGAKVLLVGDWAQLGAIEAGGAFHMLANGRDGVAQLTGVRRFAEPWEAEASLRLRDGDPGAVEAYLEHDRIRDGSRVDMIQAAVAAWAVDTAAGRDSIILAVDEESVRQLNALAQAYQRDAGRADVGTGALADGNVVGIGDTVVTRRNDRRLRCAGDGGWVKNGDTWLVTSADPDGSLTLRRADRGGAVLLPPEYVAKHVQLGYATTVHRTQGRTVDTAHAVITDGATRESLYVAATRARAANHLYLSMTPEETDDLVNEGIGGEPAGEILERILGRTATEASALTVIGQTDQRSPQSPVLWPAAPSSPRNLPSAMNLEI